MDKIKSQFKPKDIVQFDNGEEVLPRTGRIVNVLQRADSTAVGTPLAWYYRVQWNGKSQSEGLYHETLLTKKAGQNERTMPKL